MKKILTNVARSIALQVLPDSERFRSLACRPKLETWRKRHSGNYPIFDSRLQMYDYINREVVCESMIQFLEFGVYRGESIKYFAGINSHSDSRFIGFDTFTGLPEDWIEFSRTVESTTYTAGGELPPCDDKRVSFIKGMFQDTLPAFLNGYSSNGQLVIHNDSDLYTSTLYVLTRANDIISTGTIIIFDEFFSVMHEFRALEDYCTSYLRNYETIAATRKHGRIAIRMQ
jgi:O-methyltransferase